MPDPTVTMIEVIDAAAGTAADVLAERTRQLRNRLDKLADNQHARRRSIERELAELTPIISALRSAEREFVDRIVAQLVNDR